MRFASSLVLMIAILTAALAVGSGAEPVTVEPQVWAWIDAEVLPLDPIAWLARYSLSIAAGQPSAYVQLAACPWSGEYAHWMDGWRFGSNAWRWVSVRTIIRAAHGESYALWLSSGITSFTSGELMAASEALCTARYALSSWLSVKPQAGAQVVLDGEHSALAALKVGVALELALCRGISIEISAQLWAGGWGLQPIFTLSPRVPLTADTGWPPRLYRHWTF